MEDLAQRFDAIVKDYEGALETLTKVLRHIEVTNPDAKLRVVLLNNTIVALTATIEEALRGLFQEYLLILEDSIDDYRKLRRDLQKANLEGAINELKQCKGDNDLKLAATVAASLATCLNGQSGYRLLRERIVYNQGNFRSVQVTEVSKSLGIAGLWRSVCDSMEIEDYTGETNLDARVTRLTAQWNEAFAERDLVVHRISQANGWAPERIQGSIDLTKLVLGRISMCLLSDARDLVENHNNSVVSTKRKGVLCDLMQGTEDR